MKKCSKCNNKKAKDCFHKDSAAKDGLRIYCKECAKKCNIENGGVERSKEWYKEQISTPEGKAAMYKNQKIRRESVEGRYSAYKHRAKVKQIAFELTKEDFISLWDNECVYCGDIVNGIGIDRVNNLIGYTLENSVPCCTQCNTMKMADTIESFIAKCKQIAARN